MKLDSRIRKELMRRAGKDARAIQMWRAYILFLEGCPMLPNHAPGSAVHHILWRSEYPKYIKSQWNLIRLSHEDHTTAAGLARSAEPYNLRLVLGYGATLRICGERICWNPKNPKDVIRLYVDERCAPRKIGKKYGVGRGCIVSFLCRQGIPLRSNRDALIWRPKNNNELSQIIKLYRDKKWSSARIGEKYDVVNTVILRILKEAGVRIRGTGESNRWIPKNSEEIICLYRDKKWTQSDLCKKYKVGRETMRAFLKQSKTLRRPGGWRRWSPKNPSQIIKFYRDKKWTVLCLSDKYEVSTYMIRDLLKQNKIPLREGGKSKKWIPKDGEEIIRLYQDEKWTLPRLSRKCKVGKYAIRSFLKRNEIPIRDRAARWMLQKAKRNQK